MVQILKKSLKQKERKKERKTNVMSKKKSILKWSIKLNLTMGASKRTIVAVSDNILHTKMHES